MAEQLPSSVTLSNREKVGWQWYTVVARVLAPCLSHGGCAATGCPHPWLVFTARRHCRIADFRVGCGLVGGLRAPWVSPTHHIMNRSGILDPQPARHDESGRSNGHLSIIRTDPFASLPGPF